MRNGVKLEEALRDLDSTTRREFLKKAAAVGITAAAAQAVLLKEPTVVTAGPSPKRGGTIRILSHQEVASLSPDDIGPTMQWNIITQIHNALVEVNDNFVVERVLASNVQAAKDGSSYTFNLRKGVKFQDGTEFTADDVKYTFEFHMNPDNATVMGVQFKAVDKVETPDKYTVVVKMKEPNAAFLRLGATTFIVPARYHGRIGEKAYKAAPVGTGAFRLREWRPAEFTVVEAFDQHFRGRPNVDFVRQDVVPDPSVRAIALRTGTADSSLWPLLSEDNLRFEADPGYTTFRTSSLAVNHFPLNNEHPILSDKRVRQAMLHAIDRQRQIDDVFRGTASVAHSIFPPALQYWYEKGVKQYPYSVDRARALMEEAGWRMGPGGVRVKDGQRCTFTCAVITGDRARRPQAEIAQQELAAVGIDMRIVERPVATILSQLPRGELDASLFNWTYNGGGGEPDPSATLRVGAARNFSRFKNQRVEELLPAGLREVDPAKRKRIYSEVQKIVAEEVPFLYIMYWDWFVIINKRIKGLPTSTQSGSTIIRDAYKWWIE